MAIGCPLPLQPIPVPKVWGGRNLHDIVALGDDLEGTDVGEVWLLCDREDRTSEVKDGPFGGRSLRGLMLSESDALLGDVEAAPGGTFPLLMKLLDARQNLSIQVHPDPAAAAKLGSEPKNECWYVLSAAEGAELWLGLADGIDASTFAKGAMTPDVVDLLQRFPVRAGDGVDVPAGTVHAIGAGMVLAEVQSNSDTTYRLFDWDRSGGDEARPLHVNEALQSIDYDLRASAPAPISLGPLDESTVNRSAIVRDGDRFRAEILDVHERAELATPGGPTGIFVVAGSGEFVANGETYELRRGETWLLPADLESAIIERADGDLSLLRARPKTADEGVSHGAA